jgi:Ser/Thr protein kinase RdoA (MazF antagonist)
VTALDVAEAVGHRVGAIHQTTAAQPELAARFATDDLFMALRLEPYLLRLNEPHPELADRIRELVETTIATRQVLVHGDVSPKNILVRGSEPVLLDAECAWWGDPAFDVAFCLNHLLLKCLLPTTSTDSLIAAAEQLTAAYLEHVDWEAKSLLVDRVARLLPALLLARVDGKSPVEYLDASAQARVRQLTISWLTSEHPPSLDDLLATWRNEAR